MAQRLAVRYLGGWEGNGHPQYGKSLLWVQDGKLRFRVASGCLPIQLLFMKKHDVPVSDVERVEARPARHRGSEVYVYTRSVGILRFHFPWAGPPQAERDIQRLLGSVHDGNGSNA